MCFCDRPLSVFARFHLVLHPAHSALRDLSLCCSPGGCLMPIPEVVSCKICLPQPVSGWSPYPGGLRCRPISGRLPAQVAPSGSLPPGAPGWTESAATGTDGPTLFLDLLVAVVPGVPQATLCHPAPGYLHGVLLDFTHCLPSRLPGGSSS